MSKRSFKSSVLNLSVEEENLAAVPFAVLERRVGKQIGKIEIKGTKTLPDGTEMDVLWQVQGNNELGLPTEQDLDIFVALGVLTFRSNFSKTITFTGREIARILNVSNVHGKFYQRLKLAMDRFIPLRFRALTATDEQEQVKWLNVFQEASFSLDRTSGRCTGTVTWTDKLIQSMDSGFFRLLDAGRYMELDGITAKHLYRFLAVAFERTDLLVIDARKLATEHLGIVKLPHYLSRLMQTLEPAFDQLVRARVIGSYHIVSAEDWRIALHRDASYVPERKALQLNGGVSADDLRGWVRTSLEKAGFSAETAASYVCDYQGGHEVYQLQRAARLADEMKSQDVAANVAVSIVRQALDAGPSTTECQQALDWCEIAIETCRKKREAGQVLRNLPGLLVKIARHAEGRDRLVHPDQAAQWIQRFRQREEAALRQQREAAERDLILDYERFRQSLAAVLYEEMTEPKRNVLRREKADTMRSDQRFQRLTPDMKQRELDELVLQQLAKREAPTYEKWLLRRHAEQAVLPFLAAEVN
ncbi:MAG: hypothetical protein R2729_32865 [Bryobacteraceae bacterium]